MLKAILAGTTALVIAGSSLVYAQQRQGRPEFGRGQPNVEDMRAFAEARLGALRAGLMLTPEQERNWPAFEQAAREFAMQRLERAKAFGVARRERQQRNDVDPTERLRRRAEVLSETGAALKKLADATDPLYKSLDDSQKRRFAMLSVLGGRQGRGGEEFRGRELRGREDFRRPDEFRGREQFRGRERDGLRGRGPDGFGGRDRDGRRGGERDEFRRGDRDEFRRGDRDRGEFRGGEGEGRGGFERGPRRSESGPGGFERDRRQDREPRDEGRGRGRDNNEERL
jgi:hypothetical protein